MTQNPRISPDRKLAPPNVLLRNPLLLLAGLLAAVFLLAPKLEAQSTWAGAAVTTGTLIGTGTAGYFYEAGTNTGTLAVGDAIYLSATAVNTALAKNSVYYVVGVSGSGYEFSLTPGGGLDSALTNTAGATDTSLHGVYVWDASGENNVQSGASWNASPGVPNGPDAIANIGSQSSTGGNFVALVNPETIGYLNFSGANNDLNLISSNTGTTTTYSALTFATTTGTTPAIDDTSTNHVIRLGGFDSSAADGQLNISGTQGLILEASNAGTGIRIDNVNWSGFTNANATAMGTLILQSGTIQAENANSFITSGSAINVTVGVTSASPGNGPATTGSAGVVLQLDGNGGTTQAVDILAGATNGYIYSITSGVVLTVGTGNGTGGNFAGVIGVNPYAASPNTTTTNISLVKSGTGVQTISGQIAGASGATNTVTVNGGTLILSGSNSYGGATSVTAGTLEFDSETALYADGTSSWTASNIKVASGATLVFRMGANGSGYFTSSDLQTISGLGGASNGFESGATLGIDTTQGNFTYANAIANPNSGANTLGLTKLGANTLTLSGANTYTGATAVSAGTLMLGATGALGNGTSNTSGVTVASGAALDLGGFTPTANVALSLNGTGVSGSGALTNSGAAATYGGAVTLQSASSIGGLGNITLSNTISGAFGLTYSGAGTLILSGATNGSTTTTINSGGNVQIGAGGTSGILGSGAVTDNGTLTFDRTDGYGGSVSDTISGNGGITVSAGALTLNGADSYAGGTTITSGTLTIGSAGQLGSGGSYAGNISDGGTFVYSGSATQILSGLISGAGALTVNAATTLTLSDSNTYSGATTITTGTLVLDNALAAQNSIVGINAGTGSTGANNGLQFQSGLGTGDAYTVGGLSGASNEALLDTSGSNVALTIGNNNDTGMTYSGVLSGGGSLTKVGTGTQTLTGSNGFTGGFTIENGTVSTSNANGLGGTGSTVYLGADGNSAILLFTSTPGPLQNIVVASGGTRTIQANNGVTTANGVIDADTITLNGNLDLAETGTGNIQFRGNITGAGNVIIDTNNTGAVMFQGTNNFSSLTVKAGYVTAQTSSTAFGAGTITLGDSTTTSPVFLILEGNGTLTPTNAINLDSGATNSSLTVGLGSSGRTSKAANTNSGSFSGAITLNGNNLTILNNAASSSTTAAGTLTVSGGVTGSGNLIITNNSTNTSATAGNTGGITLSVGEINNAGTITNSGAANSTAGSVGATTISAVIGSSVTNITQSSTTSNLVLSGANTAAGGFGATGGTGTVTVSNGTLQMGGATALGGVNAVSVGTSGTFDLNGNSETIAGLNNISSNGGTVTNSGAAKTLTLGGSGSYTFGGTITATTPANLALTVNMTGTQTLSGASSYTGATNVQGGTLIVSGSLSGSSAVTVGSSASLTTSAILAGGGQVGNVTLGAAAGNTGAEVDPGDGVTEAAGTGTTLTTGTFTIAASSASTLALQVGRSDGTDHISLGGDSSDKINATSVSLNSSGKLSLSLESGYSITVGDVLYLIISGAAPTGTFASVNGSAIASNQFTFDGYNWEIGYAVTSSGLFSGGDDVAIEALSVAAIPEPGAWAMMLAGTGMLVAIQRSRRRKFKTHRIL